ncbi:MAG: hypothetical protein ACK4TA_12040 [Saprospiraceae bacterium]
MGKKKSTAKTTTERSQSQISQIPMPGTSVQGPNMIVLSTDMSTIYLIDSGRAISYSLYAIGGVLIGEIRGQLTVVSALDPNPTEKNPTEDKTLNQSVSQRAAGIPVVKAATIPTNKGTWNFVHLRERRQVCVIGAVDIESSLQERGELTTQAYIFDLREGFINIERVGNTLVFTSVPINL